MADKAVIQIPGTDIKVPTTMALLLGGGAVVVFVLLRNQSQDQSQTDTTGVADGAPDVGLADAGQLVGYPGQTLGVPPAATPPPAVAASSTPTTATSSSYIAGKVNPGKWKELAAIDAAIAGQKPDTKGLPPKWVNTYIRGRNPAQLQAEKARLIASLGLLSPLSPDNQALLS